MAVVADPICLWYFVNTIALLMNRNVTYAAEYNKILVLIVTIVANCTLGILLYNQTSFMST